MQSWESLQPYTRADRRWFEPLGSYHPSDEHLAVFRAAMPPGWSLRRRGLWFIADRAGVTMPEQGWKLHVSTTGEHSVRALRAALPVLRDNDTPFKFLLDPQSVDYTNGKVFSRTASGKFITVYPGTDELFHTVGAALADALEGYGGPYILSDRRWPGSTAVYYRYGGFTGVSRLRVDGARSLMFTSPDGELVPDVRNPYWSAPAWVADPFPATGRPDVEDGDDDGLLGGRFEVRSAITFNNRGGVYLATDRDTDAEVVLKEARPGIMVAGRPADEVLRKEYELLSALAGTGHFVRPVDFFVEEGHAFLAEEKLDPQTYGQFCISKNPLYKLDLTPAAMTRYFTRLRGLWRQIAEAIAAAHRRGILLGDLSHTNVLVDPDGDRVRIIDLEAAVRDGTDVHLGIHTSGLGSPRLVATRRYDRANDWHALGGLMLGSIQLATSTIGFHRPALRRHLDALADDLALPTELVKLIGDLMDADASPQADEVLRLIAALPLDDHAPWRSELAPGRPAVAADGPDDDELAEVVEQVVRYVTTTARPERTDRLFPAHPMVYETNPLGVAWGAYGVLHGLWHFTGSVPPRLLAWALQRDTGSKACPPGLYAGQAGMAWVLEEVGRGDAAASLMDQARTHPLRFAAQDVLSGAAGYGMACLRLAKRLGDDRLMEDARAAGSALEASCVRDAGGARWPMPADMDPQRRVRVGYAYGAAGIALFLLYLHLATGEERWYDLGRAALAHDLGQGVRHDQRLWVFPRYAARGEDDDTVLRSYWDEGTAGVATTALRYLTARPDDAELRTLVPELLADSCRKYVVFPQLFHGLAGLGNVLLDAGELLGEQRWFDEARRAAAGVLLARVERPEGLVFPGEQALRETVDLATGSTGVTLFLHRLRHARPGTRTNTNFVVDELLP
ncbi:class III lanthionine synthetase LanKC [Actinoplanes sp. NPDC049118]|uniref:class III lanthionine synthetase LanKC n=1 Tax=Actinoplanes sp. NPDC049118 TaxID=3155769 RepID=UPI0033C19732